MEKSGVTSRCGFQKRSSYSSYYSFELKCEYLLNTKIFWRFPSISHASHLILLQAELLFYYIYFLHEEREPNPAKKSFVAVDSKPQCFYPIFLSVSFSSLSLSRILFRSDDGKMIISALFNSPRFFTLSSQSSRGRCGLIHLRFYFFDEIINTMDDIKLNPYVQ